MGQNDVRDLSEHSFHTKLPCLLVIVLQIETTFEGQEHHLLLMLLTIAMDPGEGLQQQHGV